MDEAADLFAGLDEVRWSRMRHAYGSAGDVPELLRGLAHPDPAVRETALDGMYAGAHHQGDVYPCTLAAIPFLLRIAARPGLPGRAEVVRLLAGIGSAEDPDELSGPYRKANQAVAAAYPLWERLLEDADPRVREAAAEVLPACTGQGRAALARLTARLADEGDTSVRAAFLRTLGTLARRAGSPARRRATCWPASSPPIRTRSFGWSPWPSSPRCLPRAGPIG
ncbi:HEAT repeat domain-containing protein [Nonomuraea thailandensis]